MVESNNSSESSSQTQIATLAGGCFWGMEDIIRKQKGVVDTQVGYTGGTTENPTYREVCTGTTGHAEAIQIHFNPAQTDFSEILDLFFRMHDPTTSNRQGGDVGTQYRSAIFYHDDSQLEIAKKIIKDVESKGLWAGKIVTQLSPASQFYPAEDYHQDYLEKNPGGYTCHYIRKWD